MEKKLPLLLMVLLPMVVFGQEVLESFDVEPADTAYWDIEAVASSQQSWTNLTYTNEDVKVGDGALKVDWSVQASESYGGFANFMRMAPEGETFDFTAFTHLKMWYNNATPSSIPTTVHLRILLKDARDASDLEDIETSEYWYSHFFILDAPAGWNELVLPLVDVGAQSDQGLWLPGWAGTYGNGVLDLDKIKGYKFEYSIDNSPYNASDPQSSGTAAGVFFMDHLVLAGHAFPVINFFDTTASATNLEYFGTGTSNIVITDNTAEAFEDVSAQLDWTIDADQSFGGFASVMFKSNEGEFITDVSSNTHLSLRYNNTVPSDQPGNVVFRMQLHEYSEGSDQEEVWIYETNAILDTAAGWQKLLMPLVDRGAGSPPTNEGFSNPGWSGVPGNSKLDWDKIRNYEFAFSAATQGTISKGTIIFDNLEAFGVKQTDFEAPPAPAGVSAVPDADNNFNLVIWQDSPGESGESYTLYASHDPITDVNAPGVEVLAANVGEDIQTFAHRLYYPLENAVVSYYYAVTATDAADNTSDPGVSAAATTNTAKGIPTISLSPPATFAADGDLSEWENSNITPFEFKPSTTHISTGVFDNDDDLTARVWMAIDNDYLYLAADVIDDVHSFDPGGNWWEDDALELFIGFYDGRPGPPHASMKRDQEPDYKLQIRNDFLVNEFNSNAQLYTPDSADYYFEGFGADYIVETRIKLTDIQFGTDQPFTPVNGTRVPIDLGIHDSDNTNVRDGVLSLSPNNNDNSYLSPRNWTLTWIGDKESPTAVEGKRDGNLPSVYSLAQNYPNPFNPTTTIRYALPQAGAVKLVLFNSLGQEVKTLVDEVKPAGNYAVSLGAENLATGLYFYRITAGKFEQTRKLMLMK